MATPAHTTVDVGHCSRVTTWTITTADHTGAGYQLPDAADRTVQFTGTWGAATVKIEGSIDGVTYFALKDPQGVEISATADELNAVEENVAYIRPRLTAVGAGATVVAALLSRNPR